VTDKQRAGVEIEVGLRKTQQLASPQSSQKQKAYGGAKDSGTYRRSLPRRQFVARSQETPALIPAEHTGYKVSRHNP
jgi:hypothetical protein